MVFVTDRSATTVTVVALLALLLAEFGSVVVELTETLFVIVLTVAGAVTVMVMAGAAPTAKLARVHVTTPPTWPHVQPVPLALTKVTPAGSVSATLSEVAVLGPALLTFTV